MRTKYRYDIDGIRAIAVLSVVLFHIQEKLIPGGFVGVDIFFVISGFLITQQLLNKMNDHSFSMTDFYRRRILRLFPAMAVMVFVTVMAAQMLMLPEHSQKTTNSGIASLFSAANIYFWKFQDTSYFAQSSLELPLLHLWSLGVEEQFYLIWPLVLLICLRKNMALGWLISVCIFLSISVAHITFSSDPSAAYYTLHCRAGELLAGASAAWFLSTENSIQQYIARYAESIRVISYMTLGYVLFTYDGHMHFPGWAVLPPVIATLGLLLTGHFSQGWSSRCLTWSWMTFYGNISYSLYLWHWPVMAFYHYGNFHVTSTSVIMLFGLMTCLGWCSYRWIETPARHLQWSHVKTINVAYILPVAMMTVVFYVLSVHLSGFGVRFGDVAYSEALTKKQNETTPASKDPNVCQVSRLNEHPYLLSESRCVTNKDLEKEPSVFMFGDSNAAHYVQIMTSLASQAKRSIRNIEIGACPPLYRDFKRFTQVSRVPHCEYAMPKIWDEADKYSHIIISANWLGYLGSDPEFLNVFFSQLQQRIKPSQQVLLIGKAPVLTGFDRQCMQKALSFPVINCDQQRYPLTEDINRINAELFQQASRLKNVTFVDFNTVFCQNGTCQAFDKKGFLLYYDQSHLSEKGIQSAIDNLNKNDFNLIKEKILNFFVFYIDN